MKKLFILSVPILLATTLLLATGLVNVNTFGQIANQTSAAANQTSAAGNQTSAAGNQTSAAGNQTSAAGNQTGGNLNEKLFALAGQAIAAYKDDNNTGAEKILGQIQQDLSQATGKQIVVLPPSDSSSAQTHLILALAQTHLVLALAQTHLVLALAQTHLILALAQTHLVLALAALALLTKTIQVNILFFL